MIRTIRGMEPVGRVNRWSAHPGEDTTYGKGQGKEAGFEVDDDGRTVGGYVHSPHEASFPYLLLVLPDIFGWRLPQTRRFADALGTALRAHTVVPDILRGSSIDPFVFPDIAKEYSSWAASNPLPRIAADVTSVAEGIGAAKDLAGVVLVGLGWSAGAAVYAASQQTFPVHALATVGAGELTPDAVAALATSSAKVRALLLVSPEEETLKGVEVPAGSTVQVQVLEGDALSRIHALQVGELPGHAEKLEQMVRRIAEFVTSQPH